MDDILSAQQAGVLAERAAPNPLLVFDFDGTLAPIVGDPQQAAMRRLTCALFERLSFHYECAVLSGRRLDEIEKIMAGLSRVRLVGNHGMEWPDASVKTARFAELTRAWLADLVRPLAEIPGVVVENKSLSLSLHYRLAPDPARALDAILRLVTGLPDARVEPGKRVVNVLPADAPDKRAALEMLLAKSGRSTAIFVGDDSTDERVFAGAAPDRVLSIRVGRDETSCAPFYLRAQADVDELISRLLRISRERNVPGGG